MKSLDWTVNQYDLYPYKKMKFGQKAIVEGRPSQDTGKYGYPQTGREAWEETNSANHLISDFQSLELWEIYFCSLSHPVCDTSLWQP